MPRMPREPSYSMAGLFVPEMKPSLADSLLSNREYTICCFLAFHSNYTVTVIIMNSRTMEKSSKLI